MLSRVATLFLSSSVVNIPDFGKKSNFTANPNCAGEIISGCLLRKVDCCVSDVCTIHALQHSTRRTVPMKVEPQLERLGTGRDRSESILRCSMYPHVPFYRGTPDMYCAIKSLFVSKHFLFYSFSVGEGFGCD